MNHSGWFSFGASSANFYWSKFAMNDLSKNLNWQNLVIGAVLSILAGLAFFVVPTDVAADSRFGGSLVVGLWLFFFGYPYANSCWRLGKRSHT